MGRSGQWQAQVSEHQTQGPPQPWNLGTASACHQGKAGTRSLEAAGTVGSLLGMLGVTAGAGTSEVLLRTYKRKHDRVGVQSTEEGLRLQGVSIQLAECEEHLRAFGPASGLRPPLQGPFREIKMQMDFGQVGHGQGWGHVCSQLI